MDAEQIPKKWPSSHHCYKTMTEETLTLHPLSQPVQLMAVNIKHVWFNHCSSIWNSEKSTRTNLSKRCQSQTLMLYHPAPHHHLSLVQVAANSYIWLYRQGVRGHKQQQCVHFLFKKWSQILVDVIDVDLVVSLLLPLLTNCSRQLAKTKTVRRKPL